MTSNNANKRIHEKFDYLCFYTGLQCARPGEETGFKATVEHLLPQASCNFYKIARPELDESARQEIRHLSQLNKVTATSFINGLVGNAPLKVKFGLKAFLASQTPPEFCKKNQEIKLFYKNRAVEFLYQFKLESHPTGPYPWFWKSLQHVPKYMDELRV